MPGSAPSVIQRQDGRLGFRSYFQPETGFYYRTGILDAHGDDTGKDPFMADFPELLDIGLMGNCFHGLSGTCAAAGVECYQSGATAYQEHMTLADFRRIAAESRGRVFQFALGGRGDPELHQDFAEILAISRDHGIVPNLTTSGFRLSPEHVRLMKQYCGAVAVSWYRTEYTRRAIDLLLCAGVRTNIHFLLANDTLDEAIAMLSGEGCHPGVPEGVNRVVFLLFKPVGQGRLANVLRAGDERVARFFELIDSPRGLAIAGFDSCCVPGLINHTKKVDRAGFDTCEGGRFSAYITPDMKMLPCSFDQDLRWAVDLREMSLQAAWDSLPFEDFRSRLRSACPGCQDRLECMGGCPICPEIVLCRRDHKRVPAAACAATGEGLE